MRKKKLFLQAFSMLFLIAFLIQMIPATFLAETNIASIKASSSIVSAVDGYEANLEFQQFQISNDKIYSDISNTFQTPVKGIAGTPSDSFLDLQQATDTYNKGYIPSRLILHPSPVNQKFYYDSFLPSSYDLRYQNGVNKVSSIKNQGTSGACWAFSAIASLESCQLPLQLYDLSENHMKNESGFDRDPNTGGGNNDMAIAYLARWGGPLNEADDPYDQTSTSSASVTGTVQTHLQNVELLPGRSGPADNDAIKKAIMEHGAVSATIYMGGMNEAKISMGLTNKYFSSFASGANHAVDLVGWIDDLSPSNFMDYDQDNCMPSGSGAFIAKNSWGTAWGEAGYFYISYYDANLAYETSGVFYGAESTSNYAGIYQYDPLGCTGAVYSGGGDIWMANVFTKKADDGDLSAVSFYTLQSNTTYRVYVCSDYSAPDDLNDSSVLVDTGTIAEYGYFTVDIDTPVSITDGERFAVIVQLSASAGAYAPIEYAIPEYSSSASSTIGESFLSLGDGTWQDVTDLNATANLCVKAFTDYNTAISITLESNPLKTTFTQGEPLDLTGAMIRLHSNDGTHMDLPVTLDMISGYDANTLGEQTITVTFNGCTTTFTVSVISPIITDPDTGLIVDATTGKITGYIGNPVDLVIPSSISGINITGIGEDAFYYCTTLKSVTIPGSIKSLDIGAFCYCTSLSAVIMGYGVISIGGAAFYQCSSLMSIDFPDSVAVIGASAFSGCILLTSVDIPASVTEIGASPFSGCTSLGNINIDGANSNYSSVNGILFNKSMNTLIEYPCANTASTYAIPGSVTMIAYSAFDSCRYLETISIPDSVVEIQDGAFNKCQSLSSIQIPDGVTSIGSCTFYGCYRLDSVSIPESVTSIGIYAFGLCTNLKTIIIPNSVTSIGLYAFAQCDSLLSIYISASVTSIGDGALLFCPKLKQIEIDSENQSYQSIDGVLYNKEKTILMQYPGGKENAEFILPASVTTIDSRALADCTFLSIITVPDSNQNYASINGVLYNKDKSKLIQYPIGRTVTDYIVPDNTSVIGTNAFTNCRNLVSVIIPDGVSSLEYAAFSGCSALTTVNIPNSVTSISVMAFARCTSLESITIPASIVFIGGYAFDGCQLLGRAVFKGSRPVMEQSVFGSYVSDFALYYPATCSSTWNGYTDYPTQEYCLLILDLQDGTVPAEAIVDTVDGYVKTLDPPSRSHYTFGGWYKEPGCINSWNFTTDKVTDATILYAKWTIQTFTVTFNSQSGSAVASKTAEYNNLITTPAAPTRTGYTFGGWYKEAGCINAWSFTTDKVTAATTLYAKWTIQTFTVTFNSNGGSAVASKTTSYNTSITAPTNPTRSGYTFLGWYKEAGCINAWSFTTDKVTAATTLYAKWTIQTFTVTFNSMSGSAVASKTTSYNASITAPTNPTRSGYTFLGWYTSSAYTTQWIFTTGKVTANMTLYARWLASTAAGLKAASAGYSSILLTWTAVSGASNYEIYRSATSAGTYALVTTIAAATAPSYSNTGLVTGTNYYYKVRAYALVGTSKVYSGYTAIVYTKPLPATPTALKAVSASYNSIKLTWTAVSGASGYSIYRSATSTGTYALVTTIAAVTAPTYTNTSLATGTTYYYKVNTYRLVGTTKVYGSQAAAVSAKAVPATPTALKAVSASYNSIKLTWTAVSGASGYSIYRAASSTGTYALVTTIAAATAPTYTNTSLATGTTYYYKVNAYRLVGTTKVYGSQAVAVSAKPIPATVGTITVVRYSATSIKISWPAVSGASGYEIWRSTSSAGTYTLVTTQTALLYTNTGLKTGTTYYYKVRAYRLVGTTKVYGGYSGAKYATA